MLLASTEFNQSGSELTHYNQKQNETRCREHLETREDDTFESKRNRVPMENSTVVKDHMLDTAHEVMDPNQLPAKAELKKKVLLLTSS